MKPLNKGPPEQGTTPEQGTKVNDTCQSMSIKLAPQEKGHASTQAIVHSDAATMLHRCSIIALSMMYH